MRMPSQRANGLWANGLAGSSGASSVGSAPPSHRPVPQHVGAVGADHEAGRCGGDGIVFGFLVGGRAHEGDRAGDAVANRMRLDVEAGGCRLLVVDPQIERGDRARAIERELDRHAAALVEHRGDDAAVKHAGPGIADEDRAVRQARPGLASGGAVELKAADLAVDRAAALDGFGELVERQRRAGYRCAGHARVLGHVDEPVKRDFLQLSPGLLISSVTSLASSVAGKSWPMTLSTLHRLRASGCTGMISP